METNEILWTIITVSATFSIILLSIQLARLLQKLIHTVDNVNKTTDEVSRVVTDLSADYKNLKKNLSAARGMHFFGKSVSKISKLFIKD